MGLSARIAPWALALLLCLALPAAARAAAAAPQTRDVLVVGNNWAGTADIVDPHTFERLKRLNIIPDLLDRRAEIQSDPLAATFYLGVNLLIGEGHDQFVDDAFTSTDGRMLYVSRPSLADVVGIDLATEKIAWRVKVEGYRSDHMALSPDGRRLLVSASTARKVHVIDTATGTIAGEFASGDQPHENNFTADGRRIFHASIGTVYTPLDLPELDGTKGERVFQIVDAETLQIVKRFDLYRSFHDNGFPGYSQGVRPMALSPSERIAYLQLSFLHGFVEYDLERERPLRVAQLPVANAAAELPREAYVLDSAHHGIAIDAQGTKLCIAGTMSDYAAIVATSDFSHTTIDVGRKPYWATNSADGRYCFVSASGDDKVAVISYADASLVATIPVGDHPQRMRTGVMRSELLPPVPDTEKPLVSRARVLRGGVLQLRLSEDARLRVVVQRRVGAPRAMRWRTLRTVSRRRASPAGTARLRLGRLRAGAVHRLLITATDASGNASARRIVRFRAR